MWGFRMGVDMILSEWELELAFFFFFLFLSFEIEYRYSLSLSVYLPIVCRFIYFSIWLLLESKVDGIVPLKDWFLRGKEKIQHVLRVFWLDS